MKINDGEDPAVFMDTYLVATVGRQPIGPLGSGVNDNRTRNFSFIFYFKKLFSQFQKKSLLLFSYIREGFS